MSTVRSIVRPNSLNNRGADDWTMADDKSPTPYCAQCGQPVDGEPWDYDGIKVRLHPRCERQWIEAYEANRRPLTPTRSSL
jgi:hypothetical protein